MNRRNFFSTLIKGVGVFSILPPAETYARIWKATVAANGRYVITEAEIRALAPESRKLFWIQTESVQRIYSDGISCCVECHTEGVS